MSLQQEVFAAAQLPAAAATFVLQQLPSAALTVINGVLFALFLLKSFRNLLSQNAAPLLLLCFQDNMGLVQHVGPKHKPPKAPTAQTPEPHQHL